MNQMVEKKQPVAVGHRGAIPTDLASLWRIAQAIAAAPSFQRWRDPNDVMMAMLYGLEHGMSIVQACNTLYAVNGKIACETEGQLAMVLASGKAKSIKDEPLKDASGNVIGWRVMSQRADGTRSLTTEYTVEMAKRAGLWEKRTKSGSLTPWITHPERMLYARAMAFNLRDVFPDVIQGFMSLEEARDLDNAETVTVDKAFPPPSADPLLTFDTQQTVDTNEQVAEAVAIDEAERRAAVIREYEEAGETPPADLFT